MEHFENGQNPLVLQWFQSRGSFRRRQERPKRTLSGSEDAFEWSQDGEKMVGEGKESSIS